MAELYADLKKLPTAAELCQILEQPPPYFENPEAASDKKILIWYVDRYLPAVHGNEHWDTKYRHYKLQTDKVPLGPNQQELVLCTIQSEAFGLMLHDNCRDKWQKILDLKNSNPGKCSGTL